MLSEEAKEHWEDDVLDDFPSNDDYHQGGTFPLHHLSYFFLTEVMKFVGQPILKPSQDSHHESRHKLFEAKTRISSADSAE